MLFEGYLHDLKEFIPYFRIRKEKSAIRGIIEQRRRIYTKEKIAEDSAQIIKRIEALEAFQRAKSVMVYYPIHHEVDLRELLHRYEKEKIMLLPVTHSHYIEVRQYHGERHLEHGHYHIPEPTDKTPYEGPIDLILVPGVVFDRHKHRIGRGGGYYDRFLRRQGSALKVGVCYDFQLRKKDIPQQWFDKPVDIIVTPTETIQ